MTRGSLAAALGLVCLSLLPLLAAAQSAETLRLEQGLIAGVPGADDAVRVYKGVPFAAPPVGDLRWRAPRPPASWQGTHVADAFAPGCVQHVAGSRPPWTEAFMHQGSTSEDCLYLNVWTAAKDASEWRPVLVYIYGGGFSEGSGSVSLWADWRFRNRVFGNSLPPGVTLNEKESQLGIIGENTRGAVAFTAAKDAKPISGVPT